jgi:uncharacterized protein (DUF4415 family)
MSTKPKIIMPTDEEDAAINRGIAEDPDTFEVSSEQMKQMKKLGARGRPKSDSTKVLVSVRYDADVIEAFRAAGDGWQTRMNGALREWLQTHKA